MKKDTKYNIFAAVLVLVVLFFGFSNLQKEGFAIQWKSNSKTKITFLTAQETAKFIMCIVIWIRHNKFSCFLSS
jgi:hypothetical protein